ncbi:hypothetical protein ACHFCA_52000 (plasmid) [Delftia tsuruhatensis]
MGQGTATKSKAHYQHSKTGVNSVKTGCKPENVNDYQTYAETRQELFECGPVSRLEIAMLSVPKQENGGSWNLMVSPDCDQIVLLNEHGFTWGTRYNGQIFAY